MASHHRKVRNQRKDHAHKVSRSLVDVYDVIVVEGLNIQGMVKRPKPKKNDDGTFAPNGAGAKSGLNRSINDAGWGQLLQFITYKAEEAGRLVFGVDPRHTSQTCHECGHVDVGNRVTQSGFVCLLCGNTDNADVNAAKNIHRLGLSQRTPAMVA